jgi:hypothetical protein
VRTALATLLLLAGLGFVAATPAAAKEGVQARVLVPIPRGAAPGTQVTMVWTLSSAQAGRRVPFSAEGVFVRLLGRDGRRSSREWAVQVEPGRYRARLRIPRGGVQRVVIGLMGTSCGASGCRPSPAIFKVVGPVFR